MNAHAQIAVRPNIEQIVALRDRALNLYWESYKLRTESNRLALEAHSVARAASCGFAFPGVRDRDSPVSFEEHRKIFGVPDEAAFREQTRWQIDADVWEYLLQATKLDTLMDKAAKEDIRKGMLGIPTGDEIPKDHDERERWKRAGGDKPRGPVEVTAENLAASLEGFIAQADMIWRRGIANVFSHLDRRFRSHDGWKIGARIILDGAFSGKGSWNYRRQHQDSFQDIERVLLILDGKEPKSTYAGIVGKIDATFQRRDDDWYSLTAEQKAERERDYEERTRFPVVVKGDYFRIRIFGNGNAHLWFERDDLVRQANKLLGEYYGEVIPEGDRVPTDEEIIKGAAKTGIAKNFGFFPTPPRAAERAVELAGLNRRHDAPLRVLEPSAGSGALSYPAAMAGADVDCVELQEHLARALRSNPLYGTVYHTDFLRLTPEVTGLYDRVLVNPPFDRERDIDHVIHALDFLKPDGELVAIMSAGTEFRDTKKSEAFRRLMEQLHADWEDLPANSFSSVGTNVNTIILRVRKDGTRVYR